MGIQSTQGMIAVGAALCLNLLAACASAPVQEMSDARQAIRAAQNASAAQKAPDKLQAAQRWLTSAEQALQKGMYRAARRDAIAARNAAVEAMETAQSSDATTQTR